MDLDIWTVLLILVITSTLLALMLSLYWRTHKTYPGFDVWTIAAFLLSTGYLFLALRGLIPILLTIPIANILVILAILMRIDGIRRFTRSKSLHIAWYGLLIPVFILLLYFTYIDNSLVIRTLIVAAIASPGLIIIGHIAATSEEEENRSLRLLFAAAFTIYGVIFALRSLFWLFGDEPSSVFSTDAFNSLFMVVSLITDIMTTGLFLMLNMERAGSELRQSEGKYRILVEKANEAIIIAQDGRFAFVNPRMGDFLGVPAEELVGRPFIDIFLPDDRERIATVYQKWIAGEPVSDSHDFQIMGADNRIIWVYLTVALIDWQERPAILNLLTNITERKLAEENLIKSETKHRNLVETSPDMIWEIDTRGIFTYLSPQVKDSLGYNPEDLIGKPMFSLIDPDSIPAIKDTLLTHLHRGEGINTLEVPAHHRDSRLLRIEIRSAPVRDSAGQVTAFRGIARDITERKLAEDALRESEERFRSFVENASDIVYSLTPEGIFSYVSPNWTEVLGHDPGEVIGRSFEVFVHSDDVSGFHAFINRVFATGEKVTGIEYQMRHKNGIWRWQTTDASALRDSKGNIASFLGIARDITELKTMESEIRTLNAVLEQRVIDRTKQLNTALKEKELLLREIHHRVKNNLQIITSLLNLQSRYIKDEKVINAIKESQTRVKAMALVHERLYRSENISVISIAEYVKYLTDNLSQFYSVNTRTVKIIVDIPELDFDINRAIPLGLIFNELVSNSLKHAFPDIQKGEVKITGVSSPTELTFVISDTGIGISPDLDWRNSETLGLRLVISLVRQLGGTIELVRNGGTIFIIKINNTPAIVS